MRAVALGMLLLCGIAQGAEPPDADRPLGEDRKAAVVAQAKQQVVELEKQRVAAVKRRDGGLISALVNDIRLAKIELKEALKKTVEDYAREADAEAEEAARKADAEAKEKKFNATTSEKLEKQQEEQTTTDTTTLKGAMQQAHAWQEYSAQMWNGQPPLYTLPNVKGAAPKPVFGNIDLKDEAKVKAALIGEGTKNKDKALAAALRTKYLNVAGPFRQKNVDDPFGSLGNQVDQGWIDKDNVIGFPGSPEDLAARIHADSNALNGILNGKTDYLGGAGMTTQGVVDRHSGEAVLSANAEDLKALSDEDKRRLGDDDKTGKAGTYLDLLKESLIFGKEGLYKKEVRMENFNMFKALDLQKNATAAPYVKGEQLIDDSIEALKSAYSIWDSIDKYSFDPKTNTLSLKSEDIDGGQTIQTATSGQQINVGGKTFTSGGKPEDFPNFVLNAMQPFQAPYQTLTAILGAADPSMPRDFPNSPAMLATKYGPMADLAAQGGTIPFSVAQAGVIATAESPLTEKRLLDAAPYDVYMMARTLKIKDKKPGMMREALKR